MAPLRGSKGMLYEGGIREPLIIRWPGHTVAGSVSDVPVIGVDFFPTFVEVSGAARPRQELDGVSLLSLIGCAAAGGRVDSTSPGDVAAPATAASGGASTPGAPDPSAAPALADRALFWHFPAYLEGGPRIGAWRTTPAGAVRRGRFKLIEFFEDGRLELYDVATDIGEQHDLAATMPGLVAALHAQLRCVAARRSAPMSRASATPTTIPDDESPARRARRSSRLAAIDDRTAPHRVGDRHRRSAGGPRRSRHRRDSASSACCTRSRTRPPFIPGMFSTRSAARCRCFPVPPSISSPTSRSAPR